MDGSEVLQKIKVLYADIPVIIVTGYSNIKTAVEVVKLGAVDYVTKPLLPDEILLTIKNALRNSSDSDVNHKHGMGSSSKHEKPPYIFTTSPEFKNILNQIDLVAPTNYSVIIYGESGSGKEALAKEIHLRSNRSDKPFVAIDCGALSKELAASELFGHEKGSFTGAVTQKVGSFEVANGGTIFLDEVANLPYDVQVSLLRVTQERKMRRVGGNKNINLDVRIIVASNEKLWDVARDGGFREDLFHRFNEFQINVPPLRERKNEIMMFAEHFLKLANHELGKDVKGFSSEVEAIFKSYVWHGNLRELKNVVKRATLLTDTEYVQAGAIPFEVIHFNRLQFGEENELNPLRSNGNGYNERMPSNGSEGSRRVGLKAATLDAEYDLILETLKKVNYNKSKAAKLLNIDRKTIYNKIKQFKEQHIES
jgi:two-component system response regulator HydG